MDESWETRVTDEERELFDSLLEQILDRLPRGIDRLLEEVPLVVEDYPGDDVLTELGIGDPGELCGLHTGIPLTERSVTQSGDLPDVIHIYREGVLNLAVDSAGQVHEERLLEQIRITVLHEIGHHFGLDEDDLRALGYE